MNTLKLNILMLCTLITSMGFAQQKMEKLSKTIKLDSDAVIDLNLSHVEIQVETWDKNSMEIEAYIESDKLSKEELKKALDQWEIEVNGSGDYVSIKSVGTLGSWTHYSLPFDDEESRAALRDLELHLADIPPLPKMADIPPLPKMADIPEMPKMPKGPDLPELPEGMHNVNFDFDAYKKDGEKYLDKWSKEYEEKYGKNYKDQMRTWAQEFAKVDWKKFERDMEEWGEKFGKQFDAEYSKKFEEWGEKFGEQFGKDYEKRMEEWGEKYGEQMEKRAELLALRLEDREVRHAEREEHLAERQAALANRQVDLRKRLKNNDSQTIKRIKIKVPKKAKLKMNVRHGELKFTSLIYNLRADISHATLLANNIDGSNTSINVSYSPVSIKDWKTGELFLNFVTKAEINNANSLMLTSNSSNVHLGNLRGNAIINGSFGDLSVANIDSSFKNLNIVLENSDAHIKLPEASYNFQYKGSRSKLTHPKNKDTSTSNFSTGDIGSDRTIILNSKFSNVVMQ